MPDGLVIVSSMVQDLTDKVNLSAYTLDSKVDALKGSAGDIALEDKLKQLNDKFLEMEAASNKAEDEMKRLKENIGAGNGES